MHSDIKRFAVIFTMMAGTCALDAGSATWNLNPANNYWNNAQDPEHQVTVGDDVIAFLKRHAIGL